jgi:hypothetical protein
MDFVGLFVFKGLNAISFRRFLLPRTSGPICHAREGGYPAHGLPKFGFRFPRE